jgi:GNAT superfamily N-acetyltransferase
MAEAITMRCWPNNEKVRVNINRELGLHEARWVAALTPGGRIVGFAGWHPSPCCYSIAEFTWCNVEPEFQGRGIGKILFNYRQNEVTNCKYGAIILTTHLTEMYQKYGFSILTKVNGVAEQQSYLMFKNILDKHSE